MTFGTEFWSAISGAVVGGVIALLIQLVALRAAQKERTENEQTRREALGHSIMFKVMRIQSNLFNLHLHLEESFAAVAPQSHGEPWSFVLPLASSLADVHFSPDEMSLILSFKEPELTDSLMSLDVIHNSLIDIFETYASLRSEIQPLMPADMVGNVGKSIFTKKKWQILRPKMVVMNQLLTDTRIRAKIDYVDSKKAVKDVAESLNKNLGLKLKIEFKTDKLYKLTEAQKTLS